MEKTTGPAMSLSKESFSDAQSKLDSLDKKDEERKKTAELKNNLEAYIYTTREKVLQLMHIILCYYSLINLSQSLPRWLKNFFVIVMFIHSHCSLFLSLSHSLPWYCQASDLLLLMHTYSNT